MRSCGCSDSPRLLLFPLFAVHLLSYHPVFPPALQLHLPRCGGQIPCALQLMRTCLQNYTQTWMLCKKAASMIIGISMGQEICLIIGQVSLSLLYWQKNLQTDICGPERDWRENSWHPGQIIYGLNSGRNWEEMLSWRRVKNGARRLRGIYFIDPEDKEFKETNRNARKLETPMAPAVPCKTCKKSEKGETRGKTDEIKSKFACILEASESTRLRKK